MAQEPSGAATRAVHVIVRGRVQGVGFRWYVREAARRAGVTGWVQNRPDGAVEMLLAGDAAAVGDLLEEVRRGPPAARVDEVRVDSADDVAAPSTFTVR